MILQRLVFGLRKILNDCSAEQETVGAALGMKTLFPKLKQTLSDETILLWDTFTTK